MLAAQVANVDGLVVLLDHGADVNAVDHRGFSALHRAAEAGHEQIVAELLSHGAFTAVEAGGVTPRALATRGGHASIVELLKQQEPR